MEAFARETANKRRVRTAENPLMINTPESDLHSFNSTIHWIQIPLNSYMNTFRFATSNNRSQGLSFDQTLVGNKGVVVVIWPWSTFLTSCLSTVNALILSFER